MKKTTAIGFITSVVGIGNYEDDEEMKAEITQIGAALSGSYLEMNQEERENVIKTAREAVDKINQQLDEAIATLSE